MVDEPSNAELGRRLDEAVHLLQELVSRREYTEYQRHAEHRFTEQERDLEQERRERQADIAAEAAAREAGDRDIKQQLDKNGNNWRQVIYAGVIPGVALLAGVWLQLKGGK